MNTVKAKQFISDLFCYMGDLYPVNLTKAA